MREPAPIRLSELAIGRRARFHHGELEPGETCLLQAMGLVRGSRLVVRVTGDPCIVEVRSTRIGLARSVAERMQVVVEPPVDPPVDAKAEGR